MSAPEDKGKTDDVEAHRKKFHLSEDAEPPENLGEVSQDDDEDDPDFEAHRKKFH